MTERRCAWCRRLLDEGRRADAETCGVVCRKRRHRFLRHIGQGEADNDVKRIGVADPPYPGKSGLYRGHRDYGGEVDHTVLLDTLLGYDGWALATDEPGVRLVVPLLAARRAFYRIGSWVRGPRPQRRARTLASWEGVIYCPARNDLTAVEDALVWAPRARTGDPEHVIGAKPGPWWDWVFRLVHARTCDAFTDLFPGSGGGARAWEKFTRSAA